eukprot:6147110-Pyramimonas_sp.AAC.1
MRAKDQSYNLSTAASSDACFTDTEAFPTLRFASTGESSLEARYNKATVVRSAPARDRLSTHPEFKIGIVLARLLAVCTYIFQSEHKP